MTAFARDQLAAAQALRECRADARAAGGARVADDFRHRDAAALFERALELAAILLGQRGLELVGLFAQPLGFLAQIAERRLPVGMRGVVSRLEIVELRLPLIELRL